jgi:hypothetical protein
MYWTKLSDFVYLNVYFMPLPGVLNFVGTQFDLFQEKKPFSKEMGHFSNFCTQEMIKEKAPQI